MGFFFQQSWVANFDGGWVGGWVWVFSFGEKIGFVGVLFLKILDIQIKGKMGSKNQWGLKMCKYKIRSICQSNWSKRAIFNNFPKYKPITSLSSIGRARYVTSIFIFFILMVLFDFHRWNGFFVLISEYKAPCIIMVVSNGFYFYSKTKPQNWSF